MYGPSFSPRPGGGVTSIGGATGVVWSGSTFNPADTTLAAAFARDSAANPEDGTFTEVIIGATTLGDNSGQLTVAGGFGTIRAQGIQFWTSNAVWREIGEAWGTSGNVIFLGEGSAPATPTTGPNLYGSTLGDLHAQGTNGADINLTTLLQVAYDTGWVANTAIPDKTVVLITFFITDYTVSDSGAFNALYPQTAAALNTMSTQVDHLTKKFTALEIALSSTPPVLPNN